MIRRLLYVVFATAVLAAPMLAAEEAAHGADSLLMWKWINFGILAGGLAYLAVKAGGPAIKARGEAIRKDLALARDLKAECEAKAAAIEQRVGDLSAIETFRQTSEGLVVDEEGFVRQIKAGPELKVEAVEHQLSHAAGEIEGFRLEADQRIEREGKRIREETAQILDRVKSQTEQEITSLTRVARNELKAEVARLAVKTASERIEKELTPERQASLVARFVDDLKKAGS